MDLQQVCGWQQESYAAMARRTVAGVAIVSLTMLPLTILFAVGATSHDRLHASGLHQLIAGGHLHQSAVSHGRCW